MDRTGWTGLDWTGLDWTGLDWTVFPSLWGSGPGAIVAALPSHRVRPLDPELLRRSLKLAVAAFLTAAIAVHTARIAFVWYPLLAVVVVVDDDDEQTLQAARARILGTLVGGLVTFLVHTVTGGWMGVLLSILLMVPVLRALGWEAGLSTGALVSVMFLMLPDHARLDWFYVFNRALDTSVGCAIALLVGLLLWPHDLHRQLAETERELLGQLHRQVERYRAWLQEQEPGPMPAPMAPMALTGPLERMEWLLRPERALPQRRRLRAQRWPQRLQLWRSVHHHWLQWERLLADGGSRQSLGPAIGAMEPLLPPGQPRPGGSGAGGEHPDWRNLASGSPTPLAVLAVAEEQRPLIAGLTSLAWLRRAHPC